MTDKIIHIPDTPLSIQVYSVESKPTSMNAAGTLEIIFCLHGSVRFSYAYEEFTLGPGEFISVDKDAYYLYKGTPDNRCVSFRIDLTAYEKVYPTIRNMLFVCEGTMEGTTGYPQPLYNQLKGLLISALKEITETCDCRLLGRITDGIVKLFVNHFNIYFYHYGSQDIDPATLQRLNEVNAYLYDHISEKITLEELGRVLGLTSGYVSEMIRRYSIGFRKMLGDLRANASEKYLLDTDLTITEIAARCGFSDPKYYYDAFRTWYRCTPRQFRERYCRDMEEQIRYLPAEDIRELLDELLLAHYRETFVGESANTEDTEGL